MISPGRPKLGGGAWASWCCRCCRASGRSPRAAAAWRWPRRRRSCGASPTCRAQLRGSPCPQRWPPGHSATPGSCTSPTASGLRGIISAAPPLFQIGVEWQGTWVAPHLLDFWEECLTLRASQRPRPSDLASHHCLAVEVPKAGAGQEKHK